MTSQHDDDPVAARLRAALTSEADMVQSSDDGLQKIREGIAGQGRPWYLHPGVLSVAAAVVLGVAVGAGVALLGGGNDARDVTSATTATPTPSDTAASPTPSESPSTETPIPIEGDVYVYYVMDDGRAPRLYREQRPNIGMDPGTYGVTAALSEKPADPDYSSPWPAGTELLSYQVQADVATVDVSAFPKLGAEAENAAVQQLVYTVTANDKSVKQVRLLVNGKPPTSGHEDWSKPVARAPMLDVQGLLWVLSPRQGETVSSPVTFTGYGTAFEATVSWEVRRADSGLVVDQGTTMGGSNGEFGDFSWDCDLDPGSYEVRVFESSAEDGSPQHVDTKTFTVS